MSSSPFESADGHGASNEAPIYLHPQVPEELREPLRAVHQRYSVAQAAVLRAIQQARAELRAALERYPIDSDAAAKKSQELMSLWTAQLRARMDYLVETQRMLGRALWQTIRETPLPSFGSLGTPQSGVDIR